MEGTKHVHMLVDPGGGTRSLPYQFPSFNEPKDPQGCTQMTYALYYTLSLRGIALSHCHTSYEC
jgi:hypothetical protein